MKKQLNLHLISDSTGETLTFISKAVLSQFPEIELKFTKYHLVFENKNNKKKFSRDFRGLHGFNR